MKLKIKICGIKEHSILSHLNFLKIDFFGLIFFNKSPRYVNNDEAINLINYKKNIYCKPVGVFYNHNHSEIFNILEKSKLKFIQLHGNEKNNYIDKIKKNFDVTVIKAIGIEKKSDLKKIDEYSNSDIFLFDYKAKKNELPGGNAKVFNWSILKNAKIQKPWFISGGINIDNIKELLENLNPYGIDISSGVEDAPGKKSIEKIRKIVEKINA